MFGNIQQTSIYVILYVASPVDKRIQRKRENERERERERERLTNPIDKGYRGGRERVLTELLSFHLAPSSSVGSLKYPTPTNTYMYIRTYQMPFIVP